MEAVAEAQDELNVLLKEWDRYQQKLELEQQVQDFEDAKDATIEDIDEEIDRLQDLKDQWSDALDIEDDVNNYSEWLDELEDFEKASYEERLDMLADFVASWNKKVSSMKSASSGGGGGGGGGSSNPDTGGSWGSVVGGSTVSGIISGALGGSSSSNKGSGATGGHAIGGGSLAGWKPSGRKASGTKSIGETSLNLVGEEGPELRLLNKGDAIIPARQTENLMKWGQFSPFDLMSKFGKRTQNTGTGEVYNFAFDNLVLPNVDNATKFIDELKNNAMKMAIQMQAQRA